MTKFRGYFHPAYNPIVTGFSKEGGSFWIGFIDDDDVSHGMIRIKLTVWADNAPSKNTFASIHVHYDGIKVMRELENRGFLKHFEELKASTFYDVVQCCVLSDICIMYHGGEEFNEMTPRKIYEILYGEKAEA